MVFALGVFINFSKAFDTVDHTILLNKLNQYGINNKHYDWSKYYLNSRKPFISYAEENTLPENIRCGAPQSSVLRFFFL